jgi:hypothetical protein
VGAHRHEKDLIREPGGVGSPRAGDVLTLQIERDSEATRKLAEDTREVQDQLKRRDPGGDICL